MWLEHWGSTPEEQQALLPGDDLIVDPQVTATRSIDLASRPDEAFSWLAQMGFGRAGWYSYDLLDNLGRRSATHLEPAWQVTAAGETVPAGPLSFTVSHLERPHHLVLTLLDRSLLGHRIDFTLAYDLRADGHASTRLVSRARIRISGPLGRSLAPGLGLGDGVMVRRQLLGLADRCRST